MQLKKSSLDIPPSGEPKAGGAFISARHRNPEDEMAMATRKPDKIGLICAVLAMAVLAVTAAILYMNWDAIRFA